MELTADFWRAQNGVRHITPAGKANPEGAWLLPYLADVASHGFVVEIGCGPGRLACAFERHAYLGLDLNERSIAEAIERNPLHAFEVVQDELPQADVYLFHTVLMHVPDTELDALLGRMKAPVVCVSEMMGREWRREGDPPVFNREPSEYVEAFAPHSYVLSQSRTENYQHYQEPMTLLQFARR
jgi:SAM-dependent methyltransferase